MIQRGLHKEPLSRCASCSKGLHKITKADNKTWHMDVHNCTITHTYMYIYIYACNICIYIHYMYIHI